MHAPSRFPSLHRTPGPLSVPPCHLHLKDGRPRRPSLCSVPRSRNNLSYLSHQRKYLPSFGQPASLIPSEQGWEDRAVERETCGPSCDPGPNGPLSQCLIHVMRVDPPSLLPGLVRSDTGGGGGGAQHGAKVFLGYPIPTFDGA